MKPSLKKKIERNERSSLKLQLKILQRSVKSNSSSSVVKVIEQLKRELYALPFADKNKYIDEREIELTNINLFEFIFENYRFRNTIDCKCFLFYDILLCREDDEYYIEICKLHKKLFLNYINLKKLSILKSTLELIHKKKIANINWNDYRFICRFPPIKKSLPTILKIHYTTTNNTVHWENKKITEILAEQWLLSPVALFIIIFKECNSKRKCGISCLSNKKTTYLFYFKRCITINKPEFINLLFLNNECINLNNILNIVKKRKPRIKKNTK
ncbi:hypothetical protein GpSGHVEth082 [Glossina pallidipes salivary gland hypertrophy virus]|uniref:Uncharacterized protein n=1 Tax=Glossina hytrovirus (isolate Glossina pallidipes/Ethiopia/Seibersdorf/-) TaxID=379529 RepID=A0A110AML4_GHVS|nr:hypothetical protein GpSGHVEth082 [Glossina pallidipes salivary gland hypertrophy virus]